MQRDESLQNKLLRLQTDLYSNLRGINDARKVVVYGIREAQKVFDVAEAAVAILKTDRSTAVLQYTIPAEASWDMTLLSDYLLHKGPITPPHVLVAPVRRRGRNWAVLVLRDTTEPFDASHKRALHTIAQTLTTLVRRVDQARVNRVRRKLERKIANRVDPKDLMYNILHGLRTLTNYDHSASLLISRADSEEVVLVAEQIAWDKAKSDQIGMRLHIDQSLSQQLEKCGVVVYQRNKDKWNSSNPNDQHKALPELPQMLARDRSEDPRIPPEMAMLCAPIDTPDGTTGILKIAAKKEGILGDYEVELVNDFMPLVSLAVQFSVQIESLREQVLQAERKHVLANLARATAHDVNHALGIMLPRVQELRHDLKNETLEFDVLQEDLKDIEHAIQTCRRIFQGMLVIARGSSRSLGNGSLPRAVEHAITVLQDNMKRKSIEVVVDVPENLPPIRGRQGDLTQVFLNLCSNAIQAMRSGGRLSISATDEEGQVRVSISDTGRGIPENILTRVMEPFYTTKENGSGLGLAICRSILRDIAGDIEIKSTINEGTTVILSLPFLEEQLTEVTH